MNSSKHSWRLFLSLLLALVTALAPFAVPAAATQTAASQPLKTAAPAKDLVATLAAIEKAIDERRKELGVPGASLTIVKDDKVVYMKGLGVKDFENKLPVTADTQFAIGSASKAFTALAVLMSVDKGKMSLDDSPKKSLPYFKLRDADTDARITVRDLLSHRSGLNRTDIAMVTNKLNREELIRVAGMAKPTAKLGEKFQYQNVMYAAAGEIAARVNNTTWDKLTAQGIFKPLGMSRSNTTVAAMQKSGDFSYGYNYTPATKETRRLPQRQIPAAAPAGAINSSARDMAQWLRFMLAGGVINGKRLLSEKSFNEFVGKQMTIGGSVDYGLGWFLRQWNGHKVVEHGGNIDGFSAQVAMIPDQKLGFVLLTNTTASPLGGFAMNTIWTNFLAAPESKTDTAATATVDPKTEVGTYKMAEAPVSFEVTMNDGKLTLTVPGQPPYPLENLTGRRYRLGAPAPPGFFATFRPAKAQGSEAELFIEQPQGNVVATKVAGPAPANVEGATASSDHAGPLKEVVGSYENEKSKAVIEIAVKDGSVALVVPGQPPYPLIEREKNKLGSTALPETYWFDVIRDEAGSVSGIAINQPEGKFAFRRLKAATGLPSADELIAKIIVAYGGEENLRKHKSSVTTIAVDLEHQGVQAEGVIYARAQNMAASFTTLKALGREIGSITSYFDGTGGGQVMSFAPEETLSGKRLADARIESSFYDVLDWKSNFKTITVKRISKVGDEDTYVIEKVPEVGHTVTDYISTKTFLLLQRDSIVSSESSGVELPQTSKFQDYRLVDQVMVPFKIVSSNVVNGDFVTTVKEVKFDVDIPESVFHKPVAAKAAGK